MTFRDHHRVHAARHQAHRRGSATRPASAIVLTTEKDAVRLAACDLGDLPIAAVPLAVGIEPADAFRDWLLDAASHALAATRPHPLTPASGPR